MAYTLPSLPYEYGALEPYLDAQTMEIHHTKHHQTYITNLNAALEKYPELVDAPLATLLADPDRVPEDIRAIVRNHGGGHSNHTFFWTIMKKNGGGEPVGTVGAQINKTFGSFASLQNTFNTTAKGVFGSGWAWLCVDKKGMLVVVPTPNQDSPLSIGLRPILGLDVWEHAYYLKYQNKRPDYINAWWYVIDWEKVEQNYVELVG